MKNLRAKSILFSLMAMMAVAVFLTSCEQESISNDDIEDLSFVAVDDANDDDTTESVEAYVFKTGDLDGNGEIILQPADDIGNDLIQERSCSSTIQASQINFTEASCTSFYAYAYGHNGYLKKFKLFSLNGSPPWTKFTYGYYVRFEDLHPNTWYRVEITKRGCHGVWQAPKNSGWTNRCN